MFTVHGSSIYNSQNMEASEVPSTEEWIKDWWYICMREDYSAIKRNETVPTAETQRLSYRVK